MSGTMKLGAMAFVTMMLPGATAWAGTPWQQFHGGVDHVGTWDGAVNLNGIKLLWSAGSGLNRASQASFSADGLTAFAYGDGASNTGTITAFSVASGAVQWTATVDSFVQYDSMTSPVYDSGYVYWAGSRTTSAGTVYRINAANGSFAAEAGGYAVGITGCVVNASATVADGRLFISTYGGFNPTAARHYALTATTGGLAWSNNDGGQGAAAMAYDAARGIVYQTVFNGGKHYLRAYGATDGGVVWTSTASFTYRPFETGIALRNDRIYLQDYYFEGPGYVYAFDASNNGQLAWKSPTPGSANATPAVDEQGNVIAFGDPYNSGQTRGYDPQGATRWTFGLGGGWHGSPALAGGYVFAGDQYKWGTNQLYLLNAANGAVAMTLTGSGPASFGRNTMLTIGSDGRLYAYSLPRSGDVNRDDVVNVQDLAVLAFNYNQTGRDWDTGDLNGDGRVTVQDLAILAFNYNRGAPPPDVNVPEPGVLALLTLGGLWARRCRRI